MTTTIIKKGTERASAVKQFLFSEDTCCMPEPVGHTGWMRSSPNPLAIPDEPPVPEEEAESSPDLAALEKAAYEKGFLQGEKAATERAEGKIDSVMRRYAESIGEIQKLRSALYAQVEREVVKLAIAVARRIVHREIQVDREIVQTLVHVALSHVAEKSAVTLCLNPDDYAYLLERRAELSQSEGRQITLMADNSIQRGGCFIQTNCGDIDARVEEQFREVEQSFFKGMN
jgi:flagellar assembly protein FliH